MSNQLKIKFKYILISFIIFIFLFPIKVVFAETGEYTVNGKKYTYTTEDDGTDGPDVANGGIEFELTAYAGWHQMGSGVPTSEFTRNEEMGWEEYEQNGVKYVVLAAATHSMLKEYHGTTGNHWYYGVKFSHIHYFSYKDTIQFKFEDTNFDSNVYNGIILDSGGALMFPQHPDFHRTEKANILDVYNGSEKLSNKKVYVTMTGTFGSGAQSNRSVKSLNLIELFKTGLIGLGDFLQTLMSSLSDGTPWGNNTKVLYTKDEIENDNNLNKKIKVGDATSGQANGQNNSSNLQTTNTIKQINIPSVVQNKLGIDKTVFQSDTEIPVIPVDIYSSSTNKIKLLDIDFFDASDNSNRIWKFIRNLVTVIAHITLYLSAGLTLTMLIWRSVMFAKAAFGDDPEGAADTKKMMDKWVKAIITIVGIYLLIAGITYLYDTVINIIMDGNTGRYLIRANVEGVYSFNTNTIGYRRYLTLTSDNMAGLKEAVIYFFLALINILWFLLMFFRVIAVGGLIIIAPITSVFMMMKIVPHRGISNIFRFRIWLPLFIICVWFPAIMVIIQKILLLV